VKRTNQVRKVHVIYLGDINYAFLDLGFITLKRGG